MTKARESRNRGEAGNSLMEFALVSVFLVPLLIGTFTVGMSMNRSLGVATFTRDIGAMFVTSSVDFSQSGPQSIAVRLAQGLGLDNTGNPGHAGGTQGNGVVLLSVVLRVGTRECNTLSTSALRTSCNTEIGNGNTPRYVFTRRIVIGNKNKGNSYFGKPTCSQNADGSVNASNYLALPLAANCAAINATTFGNVLVLAASENAFVVESHFDAPELNAVSLAGAVTPSHFYVRNIF